MSVKTHFPELIEATTGADAAKRQDVLGARHAPEHTRLLATGADEGLATGFYDPRTNEEAAAAEGAILHAICVADEVAQLLIHRFGAVGAGAFLAGGGDELFDFIPE